MDAWSDNPIRCDFRVQQYQASFLFGDIFHWHEASGAGLLLGVGASPDWHQVSRAAIVLLHDESWPDRVGEQVPEVPLE